VTAAVREVRVLSHRGEEMKDGPMSRKGTIVAVKSVARHLNMVAVTRLVNTGKSVCLLRDHLLVVTA
jgi:hypothetical protein